MCSESWAREAVTNEVGGGAPAYRQRWVSKCVCATPGTWRYPVCSSRSHAHGQNMTSAHRLLLPQ